MLKYFVHFLGKDILVKEGLINSKQRQHSFDPTVDVVTLSEFTNSAMRTLHKFIPNEINAYDDRLKAVHTLKMSDTVLNMELVRRHYVEMVRGMVVDGMEDERYGYSSDIRNKMFKDCYGNGLDLDAVDTMRGREGGVPPYIDFVRLYTGVNVRSWEDMKQFFPAEVIPLLQRIFKHPRNVDVKFGTMLEKKLRERTGVVKANIFIDQFKITKAGDRFFYLNNRFTKGIFVPLFPAYA